MSGSFFVPVRAKASFFSDLFNIDASANTNITNQSEIETNSQNIGLLQANVSSAEVIQDKKDKNNKDKKTVDENKEVAILSDNALVPATGPAGISDGTDSSDVSSDDISVYVVRDGDTVESTKGHKGIAEMFSVSPNTIYWANGMKKGDKLVVGGTLIILPVDGVQITVTKGQTLKGLAQKYKVDVFDIASFNGIAEDTELAVGDQLIIPDGTIADNGGDKPIKNSSTKKDNSYDAHLANISGYFMNPVPGARLTQGLHAHGLAVDLGIPRGTSVHAAASGIVTFARLAYNGGFGGLVIISHPNGTETLYAHLSDLSTHVGENVSQNETIAFSGGVPGTSYAGHSTGAHLHFEVHGARNPGGVCRVGSTLNADWK